MAISFNLLTFSISTIAGLGAFVANYMHDSLIVEIGEEKIPFRDLFTKTKELLEGEENSGSIEAVIRSSKYPEDKCPIKISKKPSSYGRWEANLKLPDLLTKEEGSIGKYSGFFSLLNNKWLLNRCRSAREGKRPKEIDIHPNYFLKEWFMSQGILSNNRGFKAMKKDLFEGIVGFFKKALWGEEAMEPKEADRELFELFKSIFQERDPLKYALKKNEFRGKFTQKMSSLGSDDQEKLKIKVLLLNEYMNISFKGWKIREDVEVLEGDNGLDGKFEDALQMEADFPIRHLYKEIKFIEFLEMGRGGIQGSQ